jgi:hypothetical protein
VFNSESNWVVLFQWRFCGNVAASFPWKDYPVMARPGPETQAKRRREQDKRDKRRAKQEKRALRRAQKKANSEMTDSGETPAS